MPSVLPEQVRGRAASCGHHVEGGWYGEVSRYWRLRAPAIPFDRGSITATAVYDPRGRDLKPPVSCFQCTLAVAVCSQ